MLDGILLEQRGIPTAAVLTDAFVPNADAIAEAHGATGYPFAMVPHPLASATPEELTQEAKQLLPHLLRLLVRH